MKLKNILNPLKEGYVNQDVVEKYTTECLDRIAAASKVSKPIDRINIAEAMVKHLQMSVIRHKNAVLKYDND